MSKIPLEQLRYPIGKFQIPDSINRELLDKWIAVLEHLPVNLAALVNPLTEEQLETPFREGGWTVRQLIHHISDSHHNSYIRFKWALTEDQPTIKAYDEKKWSSLFDAKSAPIILSLNHLTAVHAKLVYLLKGLTEEQLERSFIHPESHAEIPLKLNIGIYAWHSNHHFAHIKNLVDRNGW